MPENELKEKLSLVPALDKAISIFEYLQKNPACTLSRICRDLAFPKTSVFQILKVLCRRGYARMDENGAYRLGLKFCEIANSVLLDTDIRNEALPYLHELMRSTRQTCHLAVRQDDTAVYAAKILYEGSSVVHSWIGKTLNMHATSLGRCLIAWESPEEIERLLRIYPLQAYTPHTVTDHQAYLDILARTRERGWAEEREENRIGVHCLGVPVRDVTKKVVAAISVSGMAAEITGETREMLLRELRKAGSALSASLGYQP